MSKVLGLDLGTGASCVSVIEAGKPVVVVNEEGTRTTPSVVQIDGSDIKVGNGAKRSMVTKPKNTVSFIKRFMGAAYDDADVQKMLKMVTYDVVNKNGKPYVSIDGKEYSPEQISSFIINKMKKVAEDYVGETISDAVITVPACFGDAARTATKTAGELAGLNVLRVINEPTSAALAADLMSDKKDKTVVVVDSGCGTVDVSVLELSDGVAEVLASNGDVFLGGQNYDNAIVDWVVSEFKKSDNIDLKGDSMAMARVIEASEKAKIELSSSSSAEISLPYISINKETSMPVNLSMTLLRSRFESLVKEFNDRTVEKAKEAVKKAGKKYSDIDCILLVGGTTRIPSLQDALASEFNRPLNKSVNPDEAVSLGAAKQADVLAGNSEGDVLLLDVTPLSLGIETMGGVMTKIVDANTTIPTTKKQVFSTAEDNQPAVTVNVLQGERTMAVDNKSIGMFTLEGIVPARRGVPQIEVTFDIDANGIVKVSAKDLGTGKEQKVTIENNSLSESEIEQIKKDAEKYAEEDKKKQEDINAINEASSFAFTVNNMLTDDSVKDSISDTEKSDIQKAVKDVEDALKENDPEKVRNAKETLEKAWSPIASKLYQQQNAAGTEDGANGTPFDDIVKNAGV